MRRSIFTSFADFFANKELELFPPLKKLPIKIPKTIAKQNRLVNNFYASFDK